MCGIGVIGDGGGASECGGRGGRGQEVLKRVRRVKEASGWEEVMVMKRVKEAN